MSVHDGDGGSGHYGGFWDHPPERSVAPWIIGAVIASGLAVMGVITYMIFFTKTSAGRDNAAAPPATTGPSSGAQPSAPAHTLTVPTAFDGYKPATSTTAKHALTTMQTALTNSTSKYAGAFANAQTGVYDKGTVASSRIMFAGVAAADSPKLTTDLTAGSAGTVENDMLTIFKVTKPRSYPAGPLGGALRCGSGKSSGTSVTVCGWTDMATSALVVEPSSLTGTTAAKIALALRKAAEQ